MKDVTNITKQLSTRVDPSVIKLRGFEHFSFLRLCGLRQFWYAIFLQYTYPTTCGSQLLGQFLGSSFKLVPRLLRKPCGWGWSSFIGLRKPITVSLSGLTARHRSCACLALALWKYRTTFNFAMKKTAIQMYQYRLILSLDKETSTFSYQAAFPRKPWIKILQMNTRKAKN